MGFFNAAFRLGAIQGFQNRQEEIAEEQEKLLEDDKRVARKAISSIENVKAKRKQLDQNVNNMFELTKNIAEGANPDAYKNMLKQWALTHGSKINQSVAERLARKSVEEINAFMPVEEPAPESPPETEEEESGPGFLASVFSPSARAAAQREKIFKKPPGVSDAEWKAALADQDIPAYGEPSQPVRSSSETTGADRDVILDTMTSKVEKIRDAAPKTNDLVTEDESRFKNLWKDIKIWMTGGTVYDTYYRKNIDRLVADVDDLDDFLKNKRKGSRLTPEDIEKIKKIGIQEFLKDADADADPVPVPAVPPVPAPPVSSSTQIPKTKSPYKP
jgi:hypothetical protein